MRVTVFLKQLIIYFSVNIGHFYKSVFNLHDTTYTHVEFCFYAQLSFVQAWNASIREKMEKEQKEV